MNRNSEKVITFYQPRYDFLLTRKNRQTNNNNSSSNNNNNKLQQQTLDYQTTKSYNLPVINNTGKYFVNKPNEDKFKITEMNYGVTSNPYVTNENYGVTRNLYATYPKQQTKPSIYPKQQTWASVYQKRQIKQPSVYQNRRLYQRTTKSQPLSSKTVRKGNVKKGKKSDKPEQPELLYKISLPCAKNCCYCVFTSCLGPVKVFVSQQGKQKEDTLPDIDASKKKVTKKKSQPVSINSPQKTTQTRKNR